jgi:hypothetical protein
MRRRRSPEVVSGRINTDGSIAAGEGFTVAKGTTGVYTITMLSGFRLIAVTTASAAGGNQVVAMDTFTERSFIVRIYQAASATAVDSPFTFIATGI